MRASEVGLQRIGSMREFRCVRERETMALKQKKFNYFDAFEAQADLACQEARLLIEIIENYGAAENLLSDIERAHEIEHKADTICHDVFTAVSTDFVTPLEREDIIAITNTLDTIIDYMEATVQRFYMLDVKSMHPQAAEFAHLILKICEALKVALGDFRNFKNSKNLRQRIIDVNDVESEADGLFIRVSHELFSNCELDPLYVIAWDKLFQRMEDTADACEHAADIMGTVMLMNC